MPGDGAGGTGGDTLWDALVHDTVLGALRIALRATDRAIPRAARDLAAEALAALAGTTAPPGTTVDRVREHAARLGLSVAIDVSGDVARQDVRDALVGTVGELLTNVARHSGQREAAVIGTLDATRLELVVSDTGRGYDTTSTPHSIGLAASVVGRMARIGGRADVDSAPAHGTRWTLTWDDAAPGNPRAEPTPGTGPAARRAADLEASVGPTLRRLTRGGRLGRSEALELALLEAGLRDQLCAPSLLDAPLVRELAAARGRSVAVDIVAARSATPHEVDGPDDTLGRRLLGIVLRAAGPGTAIRVVWHPASASAARTISAVGPDLRPLVDGVLTACAVDTRSQAFEVTLDEDALLIRVGPGQATGRDPAGSPPERG